jgi:hypothetical protein
VPEIGALPNHWNNLAAISGCMATNKIDTNIGVVDISDIPGRRSKRTSATSDRRPDCPFLSPKDRK